MYGKTVEGLAMHCSSPELAAHSASDTIVTSASSNFDDVVDPHGSVKPHPGEGLHSGRIKILTIDFGSLPDIIRG